MKHLFNLTVAILLTVTLVACGNNNDNNNATDNNGAVNNGANNTGMDQNNDNDDANGNNNANDNDNNNGNGNDSDITFSDQAADQVATMDEVENAAVIRIGDNAYVGVDFTEGTKESDDLTNRISDQVKSVEADVDRVYVSADPNFFQSINEYRDQFNAGEPVEGLVDGIRDLVQRVFPNAVQQ